MEPVFHFCDDDAGIGTQPSLRFVLTAVVVVGVLGAILVRLVVPQDASVLAGI